MAEGVGFPFPSLEQAAHGVYVSPDTWTDAMYLLHLRCGQAVFSHETALFFHDLTDREPLKYTITVRTGYNPNPPNYATLYPDKNNRNIITGGYRK